MSDQPRTQPVITCYASLLNAAHLLAEESARRLHELARRYPETLPPEVVEQAQAEPDAEAGSTV
jgi:hypothetical protein